MKPAPLTTTVLLCSPATTRRTAQRRHGRSLSAITENLSVLTRTLSASTKNQPPRAGLLSFSLLTPRLTDHFLLAHHAPRYSRLLHSIIQTPSNS